MIFKELKKMPHAKGQLKKLAKGEFHFISYEVTESHNGDSEEECIVYIDRYNHSLGPTWNDALEGMKKQIKRREEIS